MADKAKTAASDVAPSKVDRITVQLPGELRPQVDALLKAQSDAVVAVGGLPIDVSVAALVAGLIRLRHAEVVRAREAAASNGAGDGAGVEAPGEPATAESA